MRRNDAAKAQRQDGSKVDAAAVRDVHQEQQTAAAEQAATDAAATVKEDEARAKTESTNARNEENAAMAAEALGSKTEAAVAADNAAAKWLSTQIANAPEQGAAALTDHTRSYTHKWVEAAKARHTVEEERAEKGVDDAKANLVIQQQDAKKKAMKALQMEVEARGFKKVIAADKEVAASMSTQLDRAIAQQRSADKAEHHDLTAEQRVSGAYMPAGSP